MVNLRWAFNDRRRVFVAALQPFDEPRFAALFEGQPRNEYYMREAYMLNIQRGVERRRRLSRQATAEGAILDSDRLAQTVAEVRSGTLEPDAFLDYTQQAVETQTVGNTDYHIVFDGSYSMFGERAKVAASAAVVSTEGLAGMIPKKILTSLTLS